MLNGPCSKEDMRLKVGDSVTWIHPSHGIHHCHVTGVDNRDEYPILIHMGGKIRSFTSCGRYHDCDSLRSLFRGHDVVLNIFGEKEPEPPKLYVTFNLSARKVTRGGIYASDLEEKPISVRSKSVCMRMEVDPHSGDTSLQIGSVERIADTLSWLLSYADYKEVAKMFHGKQVPPVKHVCSTCPEPRFGVFDPAADSDWSAWFLRTLNN